MDRLDCEYHLEPGRGSLWTIHGEWSGEVDLGPAVLSQLQMLEIDPQAYGECLFAILFPAGSRLREGYRTAEALAGRSGLRFCLHLGAALAGPVRELAWELIRDPDHDQALARSPRITFLLCPHLSGIAPASAPVLFRPRVLVAIADGIDLEAGYRLCALGERRTALEKVFRSFRWRISWELMQGPVTRAALQQKLREGRFDVLHLVAHGLPPQYGNPSVLLQQENGLVERVRPEALAEDLSACGLRLTVLTICHGALSLAGLLLRRGIPAVVAMRREISEEAADVFVNAFYPALARSGEVDTAVNRARSRLEQTPAVSRHWSDPILLWTRAPWRKARIPRAAAVLAGTTLCAGIAIGRTAYEPAPVPLCPDLSCPSCPVCVDCPAPPEPVLHVTRVAGQAVTPGQELTVPPSGDLEGTFLLPPQPYSIRAETFSDGYSLSQAADGSAAEWLLQNVRFRRPESLGETRATVTVAAGNPPVSQMVRVRVPAPRVALTKATASGGSLVIEGTAENVLAQEEQVWVEIRKPGDGNNPKCLYSSIENGAWEVEDRWAGGGPDGSYQIRAGLVAQPPGGHSCPDGLEPLDRRIVSAGKEAR